MLCFGGRSGARIREKARVCVRIDHIGASWISCARAGAHEESAEDKKVDHDDTLQCSQAPVPILVPLRSAKKQSLILHHPTNMLLQQGRRLGWAA